MKLFWSILSILFIAPVIHGMHHAARQQLQRQNHLNTIRHQVGLDIKKLEEFMHQFQEQFNKTGGKSISIQHRLKALWCALILDDTLLAQKIMSECSTKELNIKLSLPFPFRPQASLYSAADVGNTKIVRLLLATKVNVNVDTEVSANCTRISNIKIGSRMPALGIAGYRGWIDIVELLLDAGATTEFTVYTNRTGQERFVENAVKAYPLCVIECLLARNLIPEDLANHPKVLEAKQMQDRLNKAIEQDNSSEVIDCLKQDAYQNNKVKEYMFQKLAALIAKDDVITLHRLIIQGFPIFICDKQGNSLLHIAAQSGSIRTIGYFLFCLARIGKIDQYFFRRNNNGDSAIDCAIGHPESFRLLLGLEDNTSELDLDLSSNKSDAMLPVYYSSVKTK